MSEKPIVVSGTRRQIRELVDGSLEVRIHIDPRFKKDFHDLFPEIDTPVALAPLNPDFEKWDEKTRLQPEKPRGGPLCKLAAQWCKDPVFQAWLIIDLFPDDHDMKPLSESESAEHIRTVCGIGSRKELDSDDLAAGLFNEHFRIPYMNYLKGTNVQ